MYCASLDESEIVFDFFSGSVDDIHYGLQSVCPLHFISVSYHVTLKKISMSVRDSQVSVLSLLSQDTRTLRSCWLELTGWWVLLLKNILSNIIDFCDQSWIFSIITPVSHDPSEIILICWFTAQKTFLIIINTENSHAAQYFCGNCDTFYFSGFTDE